MCTGNTTISVNAYGKNSVYPCVYREHTEPNLLFIFCTGLSLCVQGTPHNSTLQIFDNRFIPVCTGNTVFSILPPQLVLVYPCVYREHFIYYCEFTTSSGLSLCVQGTRRTVFRGLKNLRFIPVCTGNTYVFVCSIEVRSVYPCVYREHFQYSLFFV